MVEQNLFKFIFALKGTLTAGAVAALASSLPCNSAVAAVTENRIEEGGANVADAVADTPVESGVDEMAKAHDVRIVGLTCGFGQYSQFQCK